MKFDPATFIGKGWTIESDNGFNPADLSGITLKHYLKKNEQYITGDESLARMEAAGDKALNADAFLRLWENKDLIPDDWTTYGDAGWIEFRGTVLRGPGGFRYFLYLRRYDDGSWDWHYRWLDGARDRAFVSPVLASASKLDTKPSDSLSLDAAIAQVKEAGYQVSKIL